MGTLSFTVYQALITMANTPRQTRPTITHLAADMHDAVVEVSDRGRGFAGDAVLRLFDAF